MARALDSIARETSRAAVRNIMVRAQASALLKGRPAELAKQFAGLLWGDLMVILLPGVALRPSPRETARRAHGAADAFLQLHPLPRARDLILPALILVSPGLVPRGAGQPFRLRNEPSSVFPRHSVLEASTGTTKPHYVTSTEAEPAGHLRHSYERLR